MPSWQFLLVDLRCHGQTNTESTESGERRFGEDSVESAARDVIETLQSLKFYPHMLVGALVRREGGHVYGPSVLARRKE